MKIEPAAQTDLPAILQLQKLAYLSEAVIYHDYALQPLTQTLEELIDEADRCLVLRAVDDGVLVGSVRAHLENGTCHIGKLIVHPDHQNRGIGQALLGAVEEHFPGMRFELFTGHRSLKNLSLYEKLGYRRFDSRPAASHLTLIYLEKPVAVC